MNSTLPRALVNRENVANIRLAIRSGVAQGSFLPSVYVLEPTNKCNVNCIMCPNARFPMAALGEMSVDVFRRSVQQIAPSAELTMLYFLGESTLHPEFPKLLSIARAELGGTIVISTNGLALRDEHVDALIENTDLILVCIDRWNREAYEKIRRGSTFAVVVQTVEKLLSCRRGRAAPQIVVKALDMKFPSELQSDIESESQAFVAFWRARGALPLAGWLNSWAGQLAPILKLSQKAAPYDTADRSPCADLWFKMIINWRGSVAMCCHNWDSSIVLGDLSRQSVAEIWQGHAVVELRKAHLGRKFQCNSLCAGCREWAEPDELDAYLRLADSDLYRVF